MTSFIITNYIIMKICHLLYFKREKTGENVLLAAFYMRSTFLSSFRSNKNLAIAF